jgi:ferrochelatase
VAHEAVLLLAFGGPTRPEEIRPFLANVLRGRPVPPGRLEEVARHYERIGGCSPLNELTLRQARALAAVLERDGPHLPVHVGMRNWAPYIADALREMTGGGIRRALGLILAPHRSESSWERYVAAVDTARAEIGTCAPTIAYAPGWHTHPLFIEAVAQRVAEALDQVSAARRKGAHVIFTAHSVPATTGNGAAYAAQVATSAEQVARRLGLVRWSVAYQSRSGNPREPWLEPDIGVALRALAAGGVSDVVVEPIGFVCDHVEILYDLDVEARAVAGAAGVAFVRAGTTNDHPAFIAMLADVVRTVVREGAG